MISWDCITCQAGKCCVFADNRTDNFGFSQRPYSETFIVCRVLILEHLLLELGETNNDRAYATRYPVIYIDQCSNHGGFAGGFC